MIPTRVAVIMAGGAGERFWPLSRNRRPKQLLNLTDPQRSLLAEAVARLVPLIAAERVFVATAADLGDVIRQARLGIPDTNLIAEPCRRNTCGCLVLAAATLMARYGGDPAELTMAVVTADHQIGDDDRFRATVATALAAAETQDALVTIGMRPSRPETGYGYIEVATPPPAADAGGCLPVLPVARFLEKPDLPTAHRFVDAGRYLWNSGMFFWRVSTFLAELDRACPEFAGAAHHLAAALRTGDRQGAERLFAALPSKSIDYALMEHARRVLVVPGYFSWDDVGAWDSLDRTLPHDTRGNVAVGDPMLVDTENCIVYNAPGAEALAVGCIGLRDMVVVVTEDGVLVVPKDRAQEVRAVVAELRRRNAPQV